MQCLPSWDAHHQDQLPLFGFTARRLLTTLLTEPAERQLELLAETIANDPVLALWIALRAEAAGHGSIVSLTAAASWLSAQWSTQLSWPTGQARTFARSSSADGELRWQQRARESVLAARLSRDLMQMADGVSAAAADAAYWVALLEQSVDWTEDCCLQEDSPALAAVREFASRRLLSGGDFQQYLPQAKQLTAQLLSAAAEVLEVSAENELAGFSAATLQSHLDYVKGEVDLAVFSSQAVEILDRLGRLDQLESQFDDLLEQEKLAHAETDAESAERAEALVDLSRRLRVVDAASAERRALKAV